MNYIDFKDEITSSETISSSEMGNTKIEVVKKEVKFFDEDFNCNLVIRQETRFYVYNNSKLEDYFLTEQEAISCQDDLIVDYYSQFE